MNLRKILRVMKDNFLIFIRSVCYTLISILVMPYGVVRYKLSGKTPLVACKSMIWLFCITQGKFCDWMSSVISLFKKKIVFNSGAGVLGDMSDLSQLRIVQCELKSKGYVIFPKVLSDATLERLVKFACESPSSMRRMDNQVPSFDVSQDIFSGLNPKAVRYEYDRAHLLNFKEIQTLLADESILTVAQEYLGCEPVADVLHMWWHTNFKDEPDMEAAQFYHFDMDRFKWLKIFIYLTDVGVDNGPHMFIEGSHVSGGIPPGLLKRGYARLSDKEVFNCYPKSKEKVFLAPKGTIIIEDTRGLHKGQHVNGDPRLILQLQFSNSLFGTNYPAASIEDVASKELRERLNTCPRIYRQYIGHNENN